MKNRKKEIFARLFCIVTMIGLIIYAFYLQTKVSYNVLIFIYPCVFIIGFGIKDIIRCSVYNLYRFRSGRLWQRRQRRQ